MRTCDKCGKRLKLPAYVLKLDIDLPDLYFCDKTEAVLWLTTEICKA